MDALSYDQFIQTPLFWLTKSEELLRSASILQAYQDQNLQKQIVGNNVFAVVRLLSGFALENIFKAIIAPTAKSSKSGTLPESLNGHDLVDLCNQANVAIDKEQKDILKFLTEHVMAYGRYHVQKKAGKMHKNAVIGSSHDLFSQVVKIWELARKKLPGYSTPLTTNFRR